MKRFIKIAMISSVAIVLAACSHQNKDMQSADDGSAQTYAMGQKSGVNGVDVNGMHNGRRHVNALTAPSNQVYYFGFDQSLVSRADAKAATIQANYLMSHPRAKIRVEGNTDNRGSREYNIALGWRRAQAVANILKQQGVASNQIQMISYGKEHPAVTGDGPEAWSLNRRVELVYVQR